MSQTLVARDLESRHAATSLPLIRDWLSDQQRIDPLGTWPQVYGRHADARRIGLFADQALLAHMALRDVTLVTSLGMRSVRMIGSVATDPACRGQGLATALLETVIESSIRDGVDALQLWTSRPTIYQRLGFVARGRQLLISANATPGPEIRGTLRSAKPGDLPSMLALHQAKPWRVQRDLAAFAMLLRARPMATCVLERDDDIAAYACFGKGSDFLGQWHDCAGNEDDVAALLAAASVKLQTPRQVMIAEYQESLLGRLSEPQVTVCEAAWVRDLTGRGLGSFYVDGLDSI